MNKKKALVICWDFPPNRSIGGRRWAKFAKFLDKQGFEVSVVTNLSEVAKSPPDQKGWISNQDLARFHIIRIRKRFMVRWLNNYSSPFAFLTVRLAGLFLKLTQRGTIFDRAIGVEKELSEVVTEIIRKRSVSFVFVTGAPFNLLYYVARLKHGFPDVLFVGDYRDPWLTAQNYGMSSLSPARRKEEQRKQNEVFLNFDYITAPNQFLLQEIKDSYTGTLPIRADFRVLPHAFDPDDLVNVVKKDVPGSGNGGKIRLIYAGTIYIGLEKYLNRLNDAVTYLKKMGMTASNIEISVFSEKTCKEELFPGNGDIIKMQEPVGDRIFHEIAASDYVLIFLAEHNKNFVTSKFPEFLPYRKPYLYFGPEGHVSQKIVSEKLGYTIDQPADLFNILTGPGIKQMPPDADIEKYACGEVIKNFLSGIS